MSNQTTAGVSFREPMYDNESGKLTKGRRVVIPNAVANKLPDVIQFTSQQAGRDFAGRYNCLSRDGNRYTDKNNTVTIYYHQNSEEREIDFSSMMVKDEPAPTPAA